MRIQRLALFFVLCTNYIVAQTFPNGVVTNNQLLNATNFFQARLGTDISSSDTTISITNGRSNLIPYSTITIGTEVIEICAYTPTSLTVCTNGRGFDNTTASIHTQGSLITGSTVAMHHNSLANEVVAIETALGPNLSNVSSGVTPVGAPNLVVATDPSGVSSHQAALRSLVGSDLPQPTTGTLGGVRATTPLTHQFLSGINTSGVPTQVQPTISDILGAAASASTDTTNASNISSGTLPIGRLPVIPLVGDVSGNTGTSIVNKINGVTLSSLSTGILKNTTITGNPSIATVSDITSLFSSCSGVQYLGFDGNCHSVAGNAVQSVGMTTPSWFTVAGSPVTSSGTLAITPTTGQTSHQVIGTCGSATTFGPCSLVAGDLPTINLAGDVSGSTGTSTVNKINGVALSGLATGVLKNTTSTGVPSIATASDIASLFSTCSGIQYLGFDGACHTPPTGLPGGSGMVKVTSGTGSLAIAGTDYAPATTGSSILKASSGGFSNATGSDVASLFSSCSGSQYLGFDGFCHTPTNGTVTSLSITVPSWLTVTGNPITTSGTFTIAPTATQTSHQVIGTCGSATTFGPCSLAASDLPTINLSGDISGTTLAGTVNKINGVSLSALATGVLKNTTTTGIPSIATASDITSLFAGCSGIQYLGFDGSCHTASGGGGSGQGLYAPLLSYVNGTTLSLSTGAVSWDGLEVPYSLTPTITISSGTPVIKVYSSDGSDGLSIGTIGVRVSTSSGVACSSGCTVQFSQTTFPGQSIPIAQWSASVAGTWDSTGTDLRTNQSSTAPYTAGTGIVISNSKSVSVDSSTFMRKFTGTGAPGAITNNSRGDTYLDTAANDTYECFGVTCAAVGSGNWVKVATSATAVINANTCIPDSVTAGGTISQYQLVIQNSSGTFQTSSTGGGGVFGISQNSATIGQPVNVCFVGSSSVITDGTAVTGDIAISSTTVGGDIHDSGQTTRNLIGLQTGVIGGILSGCSGVGCTATVQLEGINRTGRQILASYVPTLNQSTTGNAGTATALQTAPTKCSAGTYPLGIDVNGNAQNCTSLNIVNTVASGATPAFNLASGNTQYVSALATNATMSVSNIPTGQNITFIICQSGTPSTFTWAAAFHGAMTIGTTASKCNVQSFISPDGINLFATSTGVINQ